MKDAIQTISKQSLTLELPASFTHEPPGTTFKYEVREFKRNVVSIWLRNSRRFVFNGGDPTYTIWGFYNTKTRTYYAPINSSKQGDSVDFNSTTPYSAMQLNLNPLEAAFL